MIRRRGISHHGKPPVRPVELPRLNHHTANTRPVSPDELRRRVQDDIGSPFHRTTEKRSRERVVNQQRQLMFMGNSGDPLDVEQRVVEIGEVRMIDLPILRGSASDSETAMQLYRMIARATGKLGLQLRELTESSLGYWTVSFENGINIELGASDILERVDRFLAVYERVIKGNEHAALYIDARYNNGIAVQWNNAERNLMGIGQLSSGDT